MRLFRPCFFTAWFFPEIIFRIKTGDKILCLTFDDGPNPDSTPRILELLERHDIRAVFFCNGKAAEKYPDLVDSIKSKGHIIGNHGYDHLNGFFTSAAKYSSDVNYASGFTSGRLFRPPYGRLRFKQYRLLKKTYRIVLWDVMPYDFDNRFGREKALKLLKKKIRPGSIIVLHDNPGSTVMDFLNDFILFTLGEKYRFTLPDF
ncbi:MAG: polysaccharide deacetylase family protein [Bacteroidales bacterium]|nr:polysaccharide deacetylase family protein [Bacteroidales bacterium]